jgi:hypothetical protein
MRRWFLSYHSTNETIAARLKVAIESKDADLRVFFAAAHMRTGGSWSAQLAKEIAEADAFILLIGERLGPWQVLEYNEALDKWAKSSSGFPLIVVLLEGCTAPGLPFLRHLHWIIAADPTSEKEVARIFEGAAGGGTTPGELWRYASPYRGLEAMDEKDNDYFFGRTRETVEVLNALAAPDRVPVLVGNSGVGKSSIAKAGVLAALKRQAWPEPTTGTKQWPAVFRESRQWCFLSLSPGSEPLKALVGSFLDAWKFETEAKRVAEQSAFVELFLGGKATLSDLVEATDRHHTKHDQSRPPAFLLYVDQAEELYVRSAGSQRLRFSELLVQAVPNPRLRVMMSLRSDFLGHLQNDRPLFQTIQHVNVLALEVAELREVVTRPAQLLGARFESDGLVNIIAQRTAEDAVKGVGALPLLSYTLDDMWTQMVARKDGILRLSGPSFEVGGVLVERANAYLTTNPGSEHALQKVFLRCANVPEDGEPTRRRAARAEFTDEEWRIASELADYPNRLLVTVTTETGETYAEIAHEAIFRRWDKLSDWIKTERNFLVWRNGLERDFRRWQAAPRDLKKDALLMGLALYQAQDWMARRLDDLPPPLYAFIKDSGQAETQRREAAHQSEILRIKAEEKVARLEAEQEAREQHERANAEERARRQAQKDANQARRVSYAALGSLLAFGVLVAAAYVHREITNRPLSGSIGVTLVWSLLVIMLLFILTGIGLGVRYAILKRRPLRATLGFANWVREAARNDLSLDWLKPFASMRRTNDGEIIFEKGDPADAMYLIVSGRYRFIQSKTDILRGEVVGVEELALLEPDRLRTQTMECVENGEVLQFSYEMIKRLCRQNPSIFMRLS